MKLNGSRSTLHIPWLLPMLLGLGTILGSALIIEGHVEVAALSFLMPWLVTLGALTICLPRLSFALLYVSTFLLPGLVRYVDLPIPMGLILDLFILLNFLVLSIRYIAGGGWNKMIWNPFFICCVGWMIYCIFQIVNPYSTISNWATTVRNIGLHIVLFQLLVMFQLNSLKHVEAFLRLWAILVILAAIKALGQKFIGFDGPESHWLYTEGAHTHVIYSGIRYFSFFTDAANFGCHMGFAFVIFSTIAIMDRNNSFRLIYTLAAALALWGMFVSGTRAAIAIPFVGFSVLVLLLKEWKLLFMGAAILLGAFLFFYYTTIGNSIPEIRRMRTAFNLSEDASFQVRLENQAKMSVVLKSLPFGLGLGSSKHTHIQHPLYGTATDSSFVFIWVETGVVGLIFYVGICLLILAYGFYYSLFGINNPKLRIITMACTSGLAGIMVAGYGNEVLHQIPTGQTVYILMGIVMIMPWMEREING